jgi:hypothetical protein
VADFERGLAPPSAAESAEDAALANEAVKRPPELSVRQQVAANLAAAVVDNNASDKVHDSRGRSRYEEDSASRHGLRRIGWAHDGELSESTVTTAVHMARAQRVLRRVAF